MSKADKQKQALEVLERDIERAVRAGFTPIDEIARDCADLVADLEEVDLGFLLPKAQQFLVAAVACLREEQKSWPLVTDFDRLERAFDKLESTGIVCRHNFSCCGTCAAGEIWDEMEAERNAARTVRGCAHYNTQTTESAVEGHGLWFSYGSVEEGDDAQEAVGREIEAAMKREGLETNWSGSVRNTIFVAMDWKRRLPGR
jgi:hypothetical protein